MVCGITECVFGGSHSSHPLFGLSLPSIPVCLTVAAACGSGFRFPKERRGRREGEGEKEYLPEWEWGKKATNIFVALILTPSFRVTVFRKPEKASKSRTAV